MRVLFLPKYPLNGASSRYRVHQFINLFKARGVKCDVFSFYSAYQFELNREGGRILLKLMLLLLSCLRRTSVVLWASRYDLVYFHRECFPAGPLVAERFLRTLGIRTIFDYDDALFLFRPNRKMPVWNLLKNPDRLGRIMRHTDCVVAANEYLADYARVYCSRVEVIEEAEDTERIRPMKRRSSEGSSVTVGWIGSPSTEHYLEMLKPALRRLLHLSLPIRMMIVGGGKFELEGLEVIHRPWSLAREAEFLNQFDIGVMPLPDDDWSRGKAGCKARMYMSVGIPAVATAVGYNYELIRHGQTGILVKTEDDWVNAIHQLASDPALRARIGHAARRHVEENFGIERIGNRLLDVMHDVVQS